uniref:Pentatricopeptide repeat-containing protein n=1 Tax=Kalanchoe fedtschenkoi TaxID=63787 RepID=A0A7N0UAH8_KALFE
MKKMVALLEGCDSLSKLKRLHAYVITNGYQDAPAIANKLINLCAVSLSACLPYATLIFRRIKNPETEAWNSLIRRFSLTRFPLESLHCYNLMITLPVSLPDGCTFSFALKACEKMKAETKCREVHGRLVRTGIDSDVVVGTSLMRCYAGCGVIDGARKVFDEMLERDLVCWNAMIACYCQLGLHQEALELYDLMRVSDVGLDGFTLVGLLSACAHVGALNLGFQIHGFARENGFLENTYVRNALIDMYAKCGSLDEALDVFNGMRRRDGFTWNSMVVGYGIHGRGDKAIAFFKQMLSAGVKPGLITFLGLLIGCSHQGLVQEGVEHFEIMRTTFGLKPQVKHYGAMVDLFGRAGMLDKAVETIYASDFKEDPVPWRTLLSSCKLHRNKEVGELAMRELMRLDKLHGGDCVLLARLYSDANDSQGVARMRKLIRSQGTSTISGWSSIEVDGRVHRFSVDDASHPDSKQIYDLLMQLLPLASSAYHERMQ